MEVAGFDDVLKKVMERHLEVKDDHHTYRQVMSAKHIVDLAARNSRKKSVKEQLNRPYERSI